MTSERHNQIIEALSAAGYSLPNAPKPLAAYTPALSTGQFGFTSGQLPLIDGELSSTGKVGQHADSVSPVEARAMTALCALNAIAALAGEIGDLGRISRIVKVTGFVASEPDFSGQPAVVDGASELLKTAFGDDGIHTRSAVGVAILPNDSPVEVELVVELK